MIEFFIDEQGIAPTRRTGADGGFDFYVPEVSKEFFTELVEKNPGFPINWSIETLPTKTPRKDEAGNPVLDADGNTIEDTSSEQVIRLEPHSSIKIPSHVYSKIPENMVLRMSNKSGVATTAGLIVGAEIIDSSYQGQIHCHMINYTNESTFIRFGKKIVQALPIVIDCEEHKVTQGHDPLKEGFYAEKSVRGDGGFGSTGVDAK